MHQPLPRPHPHRPIRIRRHRSYVIIRQPIRRRNLLHRTACVHIVQTVRRPYPQPTARPRRQAQNHRARQPALRHRLIHHSIPHATQTIIASPHPHRSILRLHNARHRLVREPRLTPKLQPPQHMQPRGLRPNPVILLRILKDREHRIATQRLHHRRRLALCIQREQAIIHPHPRQPLTVHEHRLDAPTWQLPPHPPHARQLTLRNTHCLQRVAPPRPLRPHNQTRRHRHIRYLVKPSLLPPRPSPGCLHRHRSIPLRIDRDHHGVWQAILHTKPAKLPVLRPHHAIRSANPQPISNRGQKTANIIARKRRFIGMMEDLEAHSIESRQPALRRNPEIPIRRLRHAMHAALRKPFFRRPRLLTQIAKVLRTTNTQAQQHATGSQPPPKRAHRLSQN